MCRVGDTYPTQHLDVTVRAYIYRWQPSRKPGQCGLPNVSAMHLYIDGSGLCGTCRDLPVRKTDALTMAYIGIPACMAWLKPAKEASISGSSRSAVHSQARLTCAGLQDFSQSMLEVGYEDGSDHMVMWLPNIVRHKITPESPLASWLNPGGMLADADSCILVTVRGLPSLCMLNNAATLQIGTVSNPDATGCSRPAGSGQASDLLM